MDFPVCCLTFKAPESCEKIGASREEQVGERNLLAIRLRVEDCITGIAMPRVMVAKLTNVEMLFTAWQHQS